MIHSFYLFLLCILLAFPSFANDIKFPEHSDVVDVTQSPYFAKNDGSADASNAIQKALDDYPNGNHIIYLPKGVYLISKTLTWGRGKDTADAYRRTILQGQGPEQTIIRLKAKSPGFENPNVPKAILYTGIGPAPRYRNSIRDLAIHIEKGNPAAIGIRYNAANQGTISNVFIKANDGSGVAGVDMTFAGNTGPFLLSNLEITGFDYGLMSSGSYYGITMERITVTKQKKAGIFNNGQSLAIRSLVSRSNVPALWSMGEGAMVTLVDGRLEHLRTGVRGSAIINQGGALFLRNIATSGYASGVSDDQGQGTTSLDIYEYTTTPPLSLCATPKSSLRLAIAETPSITWGGTNTWVAISGDYGGTVDDGTDDSKAIQEAIDDGAETIYFKPGGRYTLVKDVILRKRINRIIGIEAKIDGKGRFILEDGNPPTVVIERFASLAGGVIHKSNRTLVLKNLGLARYEARELGAGDVYIEDVTMTGPMHFWYQKVWARQLHSDYEFGPWITNHGADLWILGLTATRGQQVIKTHLGGQTEVLGAHIIAGPKAKTQSMFQVDTASFSIAGLRESTPQGNPFYNWIAEERIDNKVTFGIKNFAPTATPSNFRLVPLYSAYIPRTANNTMPEVSAGDDQLVVLPKEVLLKGFADDDGRGAGLCSTAVAWEKVGGDGRVAYSNIDKPITKVSFSYPGTYWLQLTANDGQLKKRDTVRAAVWDRVISTRDHTGNGIPSGRGADATIYQAAPNLPRGTDSTLQIHYANDSASKILVRFDLSALPGSVTDAALHIKVKSGGDTTPVLWNVYGLKDLPSYGPNKLSGKWAEDSITWNNAPGVTSVGGGYYDNKTRSGGGADPAFTTYLGQLRWNQDWPFGYYFQSKQLTEFLKNDPDKLVTLIFTSESRLKWPDYVAAKEFGRVQAPTLYVNYLDPNRSVGGELIPGGYRLSEVKVDPIHLQVSFTLLIANPQVVRVEVYNEQGKRVLLVYEQHMAGEIATPFQFSAKELETGTYKILVSGEAFQGTQSFVLLN